MSRVKTAARTDSPVAMRVTVPAGYRGTTCTEPDDDCDPNCLNGGVYNTVGVCEFNVNVDMVMVATLVHRSNAMSSGSQLYQDLFSTLLNPTLDFFERFRQLDQSARTGRSSGTEYSI